jgi:polyisoprenoid-binding protein YceI
MKKSILILALAFTTSVLFAQKKTTTSATVSFDASTAIDNLPKADNKTVIAAIDTKTGAVLFEANVKNFAFANPTIQEHFNGEKWLHSDAHPSFTFKGTIVDAGSVNFSQEGTYETEVEGVLTIKGKEQKIKVPGTIVVKGNSLVASSSFSIALADYGISGAPIDGGKVSKTPKISVLAEFK